jgi:hypothetical protein
MITQKTTTQNCTRTAMSLPKSIKEDGFGESSNLFYYTMHTLLYKLHGMINIKFIDRPRISIIANVT